MNVLIYINLPMHLFYFFKFLFFTSILLWYYVISLTIGFVMNIVIWCTSTHIYIPIFTCINPDFFSLTTLISLHSRHLYTIMTACICRGTPEYCDAGFTLGHFIPCLYEAKARALSLPPLPRCTLFSCVSRFAPFICIYFGGCLMKRIYILSWFIWFCYFT